MTDQKAEAGLAGEGGAKWTALADKLPRENCPRLLVTNNINARDAFGHHCHIWLTYMVHLQSDGLYSAYSDSDQRIHNVTHWRYAVPEDAEAKAGASKP